MNGFMLTATATPVFTILYMAVIVEFGNNKNCRIPMQKAAIVQIEKPEDALEAADDK